MRIYTPISLADTDPATAPPIVLASTSPYRLALLERLGLKVECAAPGIDESGEKASYNDFAELADRLALMKANAVALDRPDALVIGGDQIVALENTRYDKPGSFEAAKIQLRELSGNTHTVYTAVAVVHGSKTFKHVDRTKLTMRNLSIAEIDRYLEADRPMDCAGSYRFETRGIALFDAVQTSDSSAIEGLPLLWLMGVLRQWNVTIP